MAHLQDLQARGPPIGYLPKPTKSILVVTPRNVAQSKEFFREMRLKVVTRSRYLGGFIGEGEVEKSWMAGKVAGWVESMETLAGVSCKHPQSAYSGLQKLHQKEWAFRQQVNPVIGNTFGLVEKLLRETFLTDLFEGLGEGAPEKKGSPACQ